MWHTFLNPKVYPDAHKLRPNEKCNKTDNNANNTIFTNTTTFILFGIQKKKYFWPFLHHLHTILLKTVQIGDRQHIFNKTVYVQSQDFTSGIKFYTSSAPNACDIFHVCQHAHKIHQN